MALKIHLYRGLPCRMYVNDVPVPVISGLYQISRFAVYRKLKGILQKIRVEMEADQNE